MTNSLIRLEEANRMLAEARDLPELRNIRDLAEAARAWARAHDLGLEAENSALTIRLTAERRIGELLIKSRADGTRARSGKESQKITLADIGVTKQQSSQWQTLAGMTEDRFLEELGDGKVSPSKVYKTARDIARPVPDAVEIPDARYHSFVGSPYDIPPEILPEDSVDLVFAMLVPELDAEGTVELGRWTATRLRDNGLMAVIPVDTTDVGICMTDLGESLEFRNIALNIHLPAWGLILLFGGRTPNTMDPFDWNAGGVYDQMLQALTEEGDVVLDVYGSAELARAVIRNNRSYIGAFMDERDLRDADHLIACDLAL